MVLGTVLDKITSLVGRAFVISAFLPILLFVVALLGPIKATRTLAEIQGWWKQMEGLQALASVVFFLGIIAFAFLLIIVSPVLKRLLEGDYHIWFISRWQLKGRRRLFVKQRKRILAALDERIGTQKKKQVSMERLQQIYKRHKSTGVGEPTPKGLAKRNDVEALVERLEAAGSPPSCNDIQSAATELEILYDLYFPMDIESNTMVEGFHRRIVQSWTDAVTIATTTYSKELADIQSRYAFNEGIAGVRPTALGNIMAAAWSYPYTRYGIDATLTWSNLQKVISAEFLKVVEDARISYDFCVNMTFVSLSFVAASAIMLRGTLWPKAWIPGIGLVCTYIFYAAAIEAARSFGAIFRSCFDLFRFPLIQELHIQLPANIVAERKTWDAVNQILVFGNGATPLDYVHPSNPGASTSSASSSPPKGHFYW